MILKFCLITKNTFISVHRKTNEQVRKLRTQIQKKEVKLDKNKTTETLNKANSCQTEQRRLEQENKV